MSMIGSMSVEHVGKKIKARAKADRRKIAEMKDIWATEIVYQARPLREGVKRVVLGYGMGADSTAIILRGLEVGFEALGIDPKHLIVLTAQTGNEFPDLGILVETHILPRLREAGIRYIQVARGEAGAKSLKVLDDSTAPTKVHLEGAYTLREECISSATIPQSGGCRKCSLKSKGAPLDLLIDEIVGDEPYVHIIGFESEETGRAVKDAYCGTDNRIPWYPLIEWGWNRAKCLDYIEEQTGARWVKSACHFCPFFGQGVEKEALEERWTKHPMLGADALILEHAALALNPRQTLFGKKAAKSFAEDRGLEGVLRAFDGLLEKSEWTVYRLRRIWTLTQKGKQQATRGVDIEGAGLTKSQAHALLRDLAEVEGATLSTDERGFVRGIHSEKPTGTGTEHFLVAAPTSLTRPKHGRITRERFDAKFEKMEGGGIPL